mmetsp:Transcript_86043/g.200065  ORF Transcript_86043/g.200065 Transcript_86043/m.200065 type:complete len:331 (+) Transcript_86043:31-1023(+)
MFGMSKVLCVGWAFAGLLAVNSLQPHMQARHASASFGAFRRVDIPGQLVEFARDQTSGLSAELSLGTLLAFEPLVEANDQLFLFLSGSVLACRNYSQLLETVAARMRVLCLPYDNRVTVAELCGADNLCYTQARLAAYNGSFASVPGNNIESRLASALKYLQREDSSSWGQYLTQTGKPEWRQMRLAGHSQGAGDAAFIAYLTNVARVVQFSGVCDVSDWTMKMGPPATPAARFFGLASVHDTMCLSQFYAWRAEGALPQSAKPQVVEQCEKVPQLGSAQVVLSKLDAVGCEGDDYNGADCAVKAHESTACNWPGASPYTGGLWQALAGI